MVSHIERITGILEKRGFPEEDLQELKDATRRIRERGTAPEHLEGVMIWDENLGEGIYRHPLFSHNQETGKIVFVSGKENLLSPRKNKFLTELEERPNKFRTAMELFEKVFGEGCSPFIVKKYISLLRKQIEPDPKHPKVITSPAKGGYMFNDPSRKTSIKHESLRQADIEEIVYQHPEFTYYPEQHLVVVGKENFFLSPTEKKLLDLFSRNSNRILTFDRFGNTLEDAEGALEEGGGGDNLNDVLKKHIHRLRRKLEPGKAGRDSEYLVSVRGIGYRLNNPLITTMSKP